MADRAARPTALVLGVGNPDRGDDGAGRAAARALGRICQRAEIVELDGEASTLLALLEPDRATFIVDACASGEEAGALRRFDVSHTPLPQTAVSLSSHGFGLHEAVELARALGQLPRTCIVYAIEGRAFDVGAPMSPPVAVAAARAAGLIAAELARDSGSEEPRHA